MALSKEQLRKIHGAVESTCPADAAVMARRRYHEAVAKWIASFIVSLHASVAAISFLVVLLPAFSKKWRATIEMIPIVRDMFHHYSSMSSLAIGHLYFLVMLSLIADWQKMRLPYWQAGALSYSDIVSMELYPRIKKEEVAYWICITFNLVSTTIWLIGPFGLLAYLIGRGS